MQIGFRDMLEKDKSTIIQLFFDFCEIYKQLDLQKLSINSKEYAEWCLKDMLEEISKNKGKVIIAEKNNTVIAFIGFFIRKTQGDELYYHRPHTFGVIYDLYVDSKYRNQTIGTKLLEKAESYFKKNGCEFSKLQVFGTNKKAIQFYNRQHYKVRNIDLIKEL